MNKIAAIVATLCLAAAQATAFDGPTQSQALHAPFAALFSHYRADTSPGDIAFVQGKETSSAIRVPAAEAKRVYDEAAKRNAPLPLSTLLGTWRVSLVVKGNRDGWYKSAGYTLGESTFPARAYFKLFDRQAHPETAPVKTPFGQGFQQKTIQVLRTAANYYFDEHRTSGRDKAEWTDMFGAAYDPAKRELRILYDTYQCVSLEAKVLLCRSAEFYEGPDRNRNYLGLTKESDDVIEPMSPPAKPAPTASNSSSSPGSHSSSSGGSAWVTEPKSTGGSRSSSETKPSFLGGMTGVNVQGDIRPGQSVTAVGPGGARQLIVIGSGPGTVTVSDPSTGEIKTVPRLGGQ